MHDFDYDAMEKKRIARGAMHMKRGSKSKKCGLPHDGLTAAQLRRLNGPVSTYKMDEPMNWESFKAMPEDLQKQYISGLQESYQANDKMLCKMFGVSVPTIRNYRAGLGIGSVEGARTQGRPAQIRDAKWEAFCNGVVGGNSSKRSADKFEETKTTSEPGEVKEEDNTNTFLDEKLAEFDEPIAFDIKECIDPEAVHVGTLTPTYTPVPTRLDVTFVEELYDLDDLNRMIRTLHIPTGKCRIRISIEQC